MLTHQDITDTLEDLRGEPSPPIEIQKNYYTYNEVFLFFSGLKKDYRNAAHFWLTCEVYDSYEYHPAPVHFERGCGHHILQAGEIFADIFSLPGEGYFTTDQVFEALSLERFSSVLANYGAPLYPEDECHIEGELLQAVLEKIDDFHDLRFKALAETTTHYVAFFWYTTD